VIIKRTKSKKTFFGCSRYPECDFASWTKPKLEEGAEQKPEAEAVQSAEPETPAS
jgi:DNA topoisomerase-1